MMLYNPMVLGSYIGLMSVLSGCGGYLFQLSDSPLPNTTVSNIKIIDKRPESEKNFVKTVAAVLT
jgi:hypothetical protein